jgi:hypothetical protein
MGNKDLDLIVVRETPGGGCNVRNPDCLAASSTQLDEQVTFVAESGKAYCLIVDGYG